MKIVVCVKHTIVLEGSASDSARELMKILKSESNFNTGNMQGWSPTSWLLAYASKGEGNETY